MIKDDLRRSKMSIYFVFLVGTIFVFAAVGHDLSNRGMSSFEQRVLRSGYATLHPLLICFRGVSLF